jgi:hypothetical protein
VQVIEVAEIQVAAILVLPIWTEAVGSPEPRLWPSNTTPVPDFVGPLYESELEMTGASKVNTLAADPIARPTVACMLRLRPNPGSMKQLSVVELDHEVVRQALIPTAKVADKSTPTKSNPEIVTLIPPDPGEFLP